MFFYTEEGTELPQIKPFKGIVYNKNLIRSLASVVAPPYDIIPPAMQDKLYRTSPYNFVRLELNKIKKDDDAGNNRYSRAALFFESWIRKNIIKQDKKEALYIYSQIYKYGRKTIERTGFIGLMKIEPSGGKEVMPHENTLLAPKRDRLSLMRSVRANLSPIFILYDDKDHGIIRLLKKARSGKKPFIDVLFEGVRHKVWRLDEPDAVRNIENLMSDKDTFIADGHHRYEVAKAYRAETLKEELPSHLRENAQYLMVYFVESDENMLTILPAHRLVKDIGSLKEEEIIERLGKFFLIEKVRGVKSLMSKLAKFSDSHAFGMYMGKGIFYILKLKEPKYSDAGIGSGSKDWKRLDVSILHLFIIQHILGIKDDDNNIEFVKDPEETASLVDRRKFKIAFFLNPTKAKQVIRIAKLGERMPRKATYFYPKPLSGLVINRH